MKYIYIFPDLENNGSYEPVLYEESVKNFNKIWISESYSAIIWSHNWLSLLLLCSLAVLHGLMGSFTSVNLLIDYY